MTKAPPPKPGRSARRSPAASSARVLTAALLLFAAPDCPQQPDRPPGPARRSANPVRHRRCAARRAICAGPRRQSRGDRNAVRKLVEGRRQARGHARRILRLRLPLLQGEQPGTSTGCCRRIRACASSIASCRSSVPTASTAARLSLEASKAGPLRAIPRRAVGGRAARARHQSRARRRRPAFAPRQRNDPTIEAELKRNLQLAGQLGATGTPLFVIGDR